MVEKPMKPKLGISVRSLARDASDIEARISEVAHYKPNSIELMCFAQDLIRDEKMLAPRVERIQKSLDDHGIMATTHGPSAYISWIPPSSWTGMCVPGWPISTWALCSALPRW